MLLGAEQHINNIFECKGAFRHAAPVAAERFSITMVNKCPTLSCAAAASEE